MIFIDSISYSCMSVGLNFSCVNDEKELREFIEKHNAKQRVENEKLKDEIAESLKGTVVSNPYAFSLKGILRGFKK